MLDVGEARFSREGTEFSYQNCITVREGHNVIGMLHSYPIYSLQEGETPLEATDPVFMPFKALEEPGSLYITGLAVDPQWRNRGIGSSLLALALKRAHCYELNAVSLVCFSSNTGALHFYQKKGFSVIRERDLVAHPMITARGKALLMKYEI